MNPLVWLNTRISALQRRFPALRRLDDTAWKTWVWHAAFTAVAAALSRAIFGIALPGAALFAFLYVMRESEQGSDDALDAFMDALGPVLVMLACLLWRL